MLFDYVYVPIHHLFHSELKANIFHEMTFFFSNIFLLFFISVPQVSIDGDSHGILTLVACVSGFIVATLVIVGVVIVMRYGKSQPRQCENPACKTHETEGDASNKQKTKKGRLGIFTIFGTSRQSFDVEHNV